MTETVEGVEVLKGAFSLPSGEPSPYPRMELWEARHWLTKAMETKGPDFIYCPSTFVSDSCSYFPIPELGPEDPRHDTPCLIGVAMRLAGRVIHQRMDGTTPTGHSQEWNLTPQVASYLTAAQGFQDAGRTWGVAVDEANRIWFDADGNPVDPHKVQNAA